MISVVKRMTLVFILILITLTISGCGEWEYEKTVEAIVEAKEHVGGHKRVYEKLEREGENIEVNREERNIPSVYRTILKYGNLYCTSTEEELYNKVEVGDRVKVNLYQNEKNGEIRKINYKPKE